MGPSDVPAGPLVVDTGVFSRLHDKRGRYAEFAPLVAGPPLCAPLQRRRGTQDGRDPGQAWRKAARRSRCSDRCLRDLPRAMRGSSTSGRRFMHGSLGASRAAGSMTSGPPRAASSTAYRLLRMTKATSGKSPVSSLASESSILTCSEDCSHRSGSWSTRVAQRAPTLPLATAFHVLIDAGRTIDSATFGSPGTTFGNEGSRPRGRVTLRRQTIEWNVPRREPCLRRRPGSGSGARRGRASGP